MLSQKTVITALTLALGSSAAFAGYDSSSTFNGRRPFNPDHSFLSTKAGDVPMTVNAHEMALSDSDNRIDESFRVPGPLKNTVSLWLRVYTEYSSEQTVFFDKKHPEVIYEVMDFRDLKRHSRNLMAYEIVRDRQLKKHMADYRAAFASLARKSKRTKPTPESRSFPQAWTSRRWFLRADTTPTHSTRSPVLSAGPTVKNSGSIGLEMGWTTAWVRPDRYSST